VRSLSAGQAGRCAALSALADHRNRRIVSTVRERDAPSSKDELAARLAAGTDELPTAAARERGRSIRLHLVHAVLPELDDAGLVRWDRTSGLVAAAAHPLFDDAGIEQLLAAGEEWDDEFSAVARERRLVLLDALARRDEAMDRRELAAAVHGREARRPDAEPSTVGAVRASLHHVHLPVLADAGLVEYDPGAGRVAAADHPLLDALGDDSRAAGSGSTGEPAEESGDDRSVEAATGEVGCTSGS
jgi:hypothetical protein